jgi:hypothetical protein
MDKIIITRHPALLNYLVNEGVVPKNTPVYSHATPEIVSGKHVCGVLPLRLASLALSITEVTLVVPEDKRGAELTENDIREYATGISTYKVSRVNSQ